MDHLPPIEDPGRPPIYVPYLCADIGYDNLGLDGFPERNGWTTDKSPSNYLRKADGSEITQQDARALLQAWLYFGFLIEFFRICDVEIHVEDFVREVEEEDGWLVLTTKNLPRYLDDFTRLLSLKSDATRRTCLEETTALFGLAMSQVNDYFIIDSEATSNLPWRGDIGLSINVLGETLLHARNRMWNLKDETTFFCLPVDLPRLVMRHSGWCPSDIEVLYNPSVGNSALYFASMLRRRRMLKNHQGCTEAGCAARQIHEEEYVTKHVESNCTCEHISADSVHLCSVLESGAIPRITILVTCSGNNYNDVKLTVDHSGPFIAISHVWSDGLGNAKSNSLPKCQILRLRKLAEELQGDQAGSPVTIWMDTLCIPLEKQLRKLAIARLRDTFEEADKVLVLDRELQDTSIECSALELHLRVLLCGWMRRLWTFQEGLQGRVGHRLYLQFLQCAINTHSLLRRDRNLRQYPNNAQPKLLMILGSMQRAEAAGISKFSVLAASLPFRTTSKPEDELVCLASLLSLDTHRLVDASTAEERIMVFYKLLKRIPAGLVFTIGPRSLNKPFKWAVCSFLNMSFYAQSNLYGNNFGICDDEGLHISSLRGFRFSFDKQRTWSESRRPILLYFKEQRSEHWYSVLGLDDDNLEKLLNNSGPAMLCEGGDGTEAGCCLLAIEEEKSNIIRAEFIARCVYWPLTDSEVLTMEKNGILGLSRGRRATEIPRYQEWCIT